MHYGIDVGGTKIELSVFDQEFNQLDAWRIDTSGHDYARFLTSISELVLAADVKFGQKGMVGIGLACIFDQNGRAVSANIPCINGEDVPSDLQISLSRPVAIENDANTLVISESHLGAGDAVEVLLAVVLGTGVAGGLAINGELYKTRRNLSCEFGHISLPTVIQQRYQLPLKLCGCGLMACMDNYISGPGLLGICDHLGGHFDSVPQLIAAVIDNDSQAKSIFNVYIDCLACFLAQLTLTYDPDVIVIGGGLSNIQQLYQRLPEAMSPYLFDNISPPKISPPMFGDSSGVRGAALLTR